MFLFDSVDVVLFLTGESTHDVPLFFFHFHFHFHFHLALLAALASWSFAEASILLLLTEMCCASILFFVFFLLDTWNLERSLYLDFERGDAASPPSDNIMFDHMCYATTPSSSNGNSDLENAAPAAAAAAASPASAASTAAPGGGVHKNGAGPFNSVRSRSLHSFYPNLP